MKEWKKVEIREICTGIFEGPHATPKESSVGGYYLGIPAISPDGHINFENAKRISEEDLTAWTKRVVPQEDDIVFTNEASLNLYAIIPAGFHGCLGRRLGLIRPNKDLVNVRYLFYYFFSPEWRSTIEKNKVYGATVERILMTKFPHFPVRLPSREQQDRIADILSCIDEKIALNTRINHNLEELAKALYKSWFENEASKNWPETTLSAFFNVITGKKDANFSSTDGQYPFFTCSQAPLRAPSYSFDGNAILLAGNGDFNVKRYIGRFEAYQRTYVLMPFEEKYLSFLYLLISIHLGEITGGSRGSVIRFITKGNIADYSFKFPTYNIDEKLDLLNTIFAQIDEHNTETEHLSVVRNQLLLKIIC